MDFINREKKWAFLESKRQERGGQFIVLWGKRRVGKTELVKQFMKDKPHVYFLSESTNETEMMRRFSSAIGKFFSESLLETRGFAGWEESFMYIRDRKKRFVLVIDEFPYLIESNRAIPSLFQKAWDEYWSKSNIFLILLGSSIAMMETEVLGHRSPLYGRRTGQWKIDPMTFSSVSNFRKGKSFEDRLMHYALAGGIPAYWLQFSKEKDFFRNLKDHVLRKGEMLYDEVEFILREELREPRYYFALLQAIAQGKRKLSEIVNNTGLSQPVANKYLGVLSDLKLVERELPVTEEKPLKSKKGLYRITDEFCRFWLKFVFPRRGELEIDGRDVVLNDIKVGLPQHLSAVYEKVSMELLIEHVDMFFPFTKIGRWWDKGEEIDIIGINPDLNSILFGEVKWTGRPVGSNVFEALKDKSGKVIWGRPGRKEYFCLFSKNGFTDAMTRKARAEGIGLFRGEFLLK